MTDVAGIALPDGMYNVFAIEGERVTRIDDFANRAEAFAAAGLGPVSSPPPTKP